MYLPDDAIKDSSRLGTKLKRINAMYHIVLSNIYVEPK